MQTTEGEKAALDDFYVSTLGEQWLRTWDTASAPCEVTTNPAEQGSMLTLVAFPGSSQAIS